MTGLVRAGLVALAAVFMLLGFAGRLPHEWLGISTATLIGWGILLAVPALFFCMLLVIMERQKQLKRDNAWIAWRLGAPAPERRRDRVVVPFRRRSG